MNITEKTTKYIFDPSSLIREIDENTVFFKTTAGKFKLSGNGIVLAVRAILSRFQDAAYPADVMEALSDSYQARALQSFLEFLIEKKLLISENAYKDLTAFDSDYLEKYRSLTAHGKGLLTISQKMQAMTLGVIGTWQFIHCCVDQLAQDRLIGKIRFLITDRQSVPSEVPANRFEIACLTEAPEAQIQAFVSACDFVIVSSSYESYSLFHLVNERCLAERKNWLRVALLDERAEIGPLFVPGETCCYDCLERRASECRDEKASAYFAMLEKDTKAVHEPQLAMYSSSYLTRMSADITIYELMHYFAGGDCPLKGSILTFFTEGYKTRLDKVFRHSQCKSCHGQG